MAGLLRPKNGEIIIENVDIISLAEKQLDQFRGKNIGLILQQSHFIASMNVLENVVLASWLATGKKAVQKAEKLLAELDLENQKHKLPSHLSIGQQQRAVSYTHLDVYKRQGLWRVIHLAHGMAAPMPLPARLLNFRCLPLPTWAAT